MKSHGRLSWLPAGTGAAVLAAAAVASPDDAAAAGFRLAMGKTEARKAAGVVGVPALANLFGVAVALGTLGRLWSGPAVLLSHLDPWEPLPSRRPARCTGELLARSVAACARAPGHPLALLIGLDLGPNLFATGSLAWLLWLRAARDTGAQPSIARASRIGAVTVPLSMAAALALLALTGSS